MVTFDDNFQPIGKVISLGVNGAVGFDGFVGVTNPPPLLLLQLNKKRKTNK
jgi:hypothetical protein